ncbi:MAG: M20/M25/M40 family metallo-hydrolase [Gemmatimonadota bacterium]|nr:MAG: M20/M25/M40 family metallo-hydrolase [Gemmatimonadota bacterium]
MMVSAVLVTILLAIVFAIRYATAMPGSSFRGALPPLSHTEREIRDRLAMHVEVLAGKIGERHVWKMQALDAAARYVEQALEESRYRVGSQSYDADGMAVRNLDAERLGRGRRDEIVLVGAHYDSVCGSPGANDNGTGVAAMLELARLFADRSPDRTVRFAAFVNEEPPFCFGRNMGSRVYARRCRKLREKIAAMLSLETIGCYRDDRGSQRYPFPFGLLYPRTGDFIGFVGNLSSRQLVRRCVGAFRRHAEFPSEGTAAPGYLPGIFWSDHWSFWRERYKAVMVTDTAPYRYPQYHTPNDTPDRVDYERTARVVLGLCGVIEELAG